MKERFLGLMNSGHWHNAFVCNRNSIFDLHKPGLIVSGVSPQAKNFADSRRGEGQSPFHQSPHGASRTVFHGPGGRADRRNGKYH